MEFEYQNPCDWMHRHDQGDVAGLPGVLDELAARDAAQQAMTATLGARLVAVEAAVAGMGERLAAVENRPVPAPSTARVGTLRELLDALADRADDITVVDRIVGPAGGVNVPRLQGGLTLRCAGDGILVRGATVGHVLRSDGTGGAITLDGFRVDGGWREWPHETPDDSCSNYFLPNFEHVRLLNAVSCYSYRTGFLVAGSRQVEAIGCTMFVCPRDFIWAEGVRDLLVEGCLVQHCGDDGLGTHQRGAGTLSAIFRGNRLRDSFGIKFHAGAADGMHGDKPSQILIEDNDLDACGLYGVHGHEDPGHYSAAPRNTTIRRNAIRNVRRTAPCAPGQQIGVALRFAWPRHTYDNTFVVADNVAIRDPSAQGKRLQDVCDWTPPANVPGAAEFNGFFSKTGFLPDATFDLGRQATLYQGANVAAIRRSGNRFEGAGWTDVTA